MNREVALRIVLALVGLAHLALGMIANLAGPDSLVRVVSGFYGATLEMTPALHHVVRILGVFMIGIGMMALWACSDPRRNQVVILGLIAILILRVLQRIMLAQEIASTFNISTTRLYTQAAFFLATAIALFLLRPRPISQPRG